MSALGTALPRLTDLYMERSMFSSQRSDIPAEEGVGNLYQSSGGEAKERGQYRGWSSAPVCIRKQRFHRGKRCSLQDWALPSLPPSAR
jgi:hypothetical protein